MAEETMNDNFLTGNGILIILFFLIFVGGGGFFGGNSNAVTQAELQNGLYNQTTDNNLNNLQNGQYEVSKEVMQNRYDNALGLAGIQKDILLGNQEMQAQMASCCCEIKSLVRDEVQEVKDLINNNTIQDLRDQLNTATIASANAVQTQNILGNIGRFYMNTPINPYYGYSYGYGTTIS